MSRTDDNSVTSELTTSLKMLAIQRESAEHNETVSINRLPVELFCMLFEYLDRNELPAYGSVCKRWAYFVAVFVRQKLVISIENEVRPSHWFYLDESCLPIGAVNVTLVANSFLYLKQLKICNFVANPYTKQPRQDLVLINRLAALEVLEISQLPFGTLSLPNLTHLAIDHLNNPRDYKTMFIDCPRLLGFKTKMFARGSRNFDFIHPESITHLYLDRYSYKETFEQLTSLQYLSITGFENEYGAEKEYTNKIFSNFPKLKEISVRPNWLVGRDRLTFIEILEKKKALARGNVALTFCGVSIENEDQLDCLVPDSDSYKANKLLLNFYIQNYSSLRVPELRSIQVIHYAELQIPTDFHEKFRHVREIRVNSRIEDEDRLIEFIRGFERLDTVGVKNVARLKESFYRKLASSCSSLPYLAVWMDSQWNVSNLDFLLEFKNLVCFTSYREDIDYPSIRRLFKRFERFELKFCLRELQDIDHIQIRRPKKGADFELSVHLDKYARMFPSKLERFDQLETFDQLEKLLQHVELNYREPVDPYHLGNCYCDHKPDKCQLKARKLVWETEDDDSDVSDFSDASDVSDVGDVQYIRL